MEYLLDSNSLIDAYNRWYRPRVFGNVWDFLSKNPKVKMTSFVFEEIKYPSGLTNWTKANFVTSQIQPDQSTILTYTQIMDWITSCTRWDSAGIAQWQLPTKADPWLIATAKNNHQAIVTMDGNGRATMPDLGTFSKREPKINSVASQFGVSTLPIYQLLEELAFSE